MPALISPDGRWWWDGRQWLSRLVEGRLDLFWFTSTPDWASRVLITGLIGLIPIVGAINLLGWTLVATEMVRNRWKELPPPGFQYLERGIRPFVVSIVYGVVLFVSIVVLALIAVLLATSGRTQAVFAVGLGLLIILIALAWWLLSLYLFAALLIGSDRLGIVRALNPMRLFALARANHDVSLHVALLYAAITIILTVISIPVGTVIPFGSLLVWLVLPAAYAILVPSLAPFHVEPAAAPTP
jgi:MFS family permease